MALNEPDEAENVQVTTPVAEPEASVDNQPTTEWKDTTVPTIPEKTDEETEESRKKGYSQRVRELNSRAKEAEAKAQSLAEKLAILTGSTDPAVIQPASADEPIIRPGEEIDGSQLDERLRAREAKILSRADALVTLRNKQSDTIRRINTEADAAVKKYPELDPDSDGFNKELSETVTEAVEAYVKADPYNASPLKFVAKLMKPYQSAVAKEVGQATENIAKQVSETALRPTSIRKPEKSASEKSLAELEAELGVVQA